MTNLLAQGLRDVLSSALVGAVSDAEESTVWRRRGDPNELPSFAAALGARAPGAVAVALSRWFERHSATVTDLLPKWFHPDLRPGSRPVLATMTEFSNSRNKYIKQALDERRPILLSRHGAVVVAVVPLHEGAYEEGALDDALKRSYSEQHSRPQEDELPDLTEEQIKHIEQSQDPAVAARYGVRTTGWDQLNPPDAN